MRIIAIINQKGGVGKTTSAINIGAGLARMNYSVLLVDIDPQANLTYSLGFQADHLATTIFELLKGNATLEQVIVNQAKLNIIPASAKLTSAEIDFVMVKGREFLLNICLKKLSGFDFVIIDCPPNLGLLTLNALIAAKEVFIPLRAEFLSVKGLSNILEMVKKVKERVNTDILVTGLIVTQYNQQLLLHREVSKNLKQHFSKCLFNTYINQNISLAEASSFGKPIFEYSPKSQGAQDYNALCKEILNKERSNDKKVDSQQQYF